MKADEEGERAVAGCLLGLVLGVLCWAAIAALALSVYSG